MTTSLTSRDIQQKSMLIRKRASILPELPTIITVAKPLR